MNLLHVDSSILGNDSVSRRLSAAAVERVRANTPDLDVVHVDLAAAPHAHFSLAHLAAAQGAPAAAELQDDIDAGRTALAQFLAADVVVIGAPMYNFTVPTQLKAWIDRILVPGKTFRYGADGSVEGLAKGKRVIVAAARGGFYGNGSPAAAAEHAETYLRTVFGFIGVTDLDFVVAEGLQVSPEIKARAVSGAIDAVAELRAA